MDMGIYDIARRYLEGAELRDCHFLVNNPDGRNKRRGRDGMVNWHRDGKWSAEGNVSCFLHCFLLLNDFTNQNGGTLVVPGTHNLKEPEYYFVETDPGEVVQGNYYKVYPQNYFPAGVQLTARRGALVLLDPMCIHAQGINISDERRAVINFSFQKTGMPPLFDCKAIAGQQARYSLSKEFFDILATGENVPNTYGPVI
jgi:ectoine hydroxylase-related dioxygenase (phytanoyl-CoA dioxygenase family)